MITSTREAPQAIPNIAAKAGEYYEYQAISPDGGWLLYRSGVFQPNGATAKHETLWIHSIDGQVQQAQLNYWYEGEPQHGSLQIETPSGAHSWVIPNLKQGPSFGWSASGEIIIYAQPMESPSASPVYPIFHFDPVTHTGGPVFNSEVTAGWNFGFYLGQYKRNDQLYEVYYDEFYQLYQRDSAFFLYLRDKNSLHPILRWLNTADWLDGFYTVMDRLRLWQRRDGKAVMIVTQPYGFDLAMGLDFEALQANMGYRDRMYPVALFPGEEGLDEFGRPFVHQIWHSRDGLRFGIQHESATSRPGRFYVYDLQTMTLMDYCLDRSGSFNILESPDSRFLAWNDYHYGTPGVEDTQDTVILDLDTGRLVRLADTEILGWSLLRP